MGKKKEKEPIELTKKEEEEVKRIKDGLELLKEKESITLSV